MISFWSRLFDLICPRACVVCGRRLSIQEDTICLCCLLDLPRTNCFEDFLDNDVARVFWGRIPIERAASFYYYTPQSEASRMIYQLKYHDHPEIGTTLGRIFARELLPQLFFQGMDAIIPVPLAKKRQRQRGYNQSAAIAQGISEETGLPLITHAIERISFSQSQTTKQRWDRNENVEQAFRLKDAQAVSGRHILLVDDIITTGATLCACAKELLQAPDVQVSVLSIGFTKS
ncbi:MAG: ComF family protein [Prevotella sp.]|nr:ComF family protein [Prevotella sp.]